MGDKLAMKDTFRFDEAGSLAKPGPIGRVVRVAMGVLCGWILWRLALHASVADLRNPSYWFLAAIGLLLTPYVVNIGFGRTWGAWPRVVVLAALAAGIVAGLVFYGSVLSLPLFTVTNVWMVYLYGHLGLSFLVAAILATPGCEMRGIPHLFGTLSGRAAREHYCPGFIDNVDRWERQLHGEPEAAATDGEPAARPRPADFLARGGNLLLYYGVPFIAIQIAGNFGGFVTATAVPAIAFLVMAVACVINVWRCRRVHCCFVGPWFLLAAVALGLYGLGVIDFGPRSWSLIVNTGMGGAVLLYLGSERLWGKYFGGD